MGRALRLLAFALALAACTSPQRTDPWPAARALFDRRDPRAFDAWRALPEWSEGHSEAQRRLEEADPYYREAVRHLAVEDDAAAQEAIRGGLERGPMDPAYYPVLARVFLDRETPAEAIRFFQRYLRARPNAPDASAIRDELGELSPGAAILLDAPPELTPASEESAAPSVPLVAWVLLGVMAGILAAVAAARLRARLATRGFGLPRVIAEQPELHPAIAMLVGSLRHELLKHRVAATRDVLSLWADGCASEAQQTFLRDRLLGSGANGGALIPLDRAFDAYVRAFERSLGGRFDASRDPSFRAARAAIREILARTPAVGEDPSPRVWRNLEGAHVRLAGFDRELEQLTEGLIRTQVDEALLLEVVAEVREEYAAGRVALASIEVHVEESAAVEVFRVDLALVLKNVVRNAILAAGRGEDPAAVLIRTSLDLEETGEETLHFEIHDTSPEALTLDAIRDGEIGRGLGLVRAAVDRYGGAIAVAEGAEGFAKAVVISFPRAYQADESGVTIG